MCVCVCVFVSRVVVGRANGSSWPDSMKDIVTFSYATWEWSRRISELWWTQSNKTGGVWQGETVFVVKICIHRRWHSGAQALRFSLIPKIKSAVIWLREKMLASPTTAVGGGRRSLTSVIYLFRCFQTCAALPNYRRLKSSVSSRRKYPATNYEPTRPFPSLVI